MKPLPHDTTAELVETILNAVSRWQLRLKQLHQRLRSHFARPEPYQHALLYLQAVLSEIPRKRGHAPKAHHPA